jgi:hypothetical protein
MCVPVVNISSRKDLIQEFLVCAVSYPSLRRIPSLTIIRYSGRWGITETTGLRQNICEEPNTLLWQMSMLKVDFSDECLLVSGVSTNRRRQPTLSPAIPRNASRNWSAEDESSLVIST